MSTLARFVLIAIAILALAVAPWAIATAYVNTSGLIADGAVSAKREAIRMPAGDMWERVLEITYRYQPIDASFPTTESQQVDAGLYSRLRVGSPVRVRYSPWRPLRFVRGWGSFLADSSAVARLGYGLEAAQQFAEVVGFFLGCLLAFVAYRMKSKAGALIAALICAASMPDVFLGFLALLGFPVLFRAWRTKPGQGYGVLLAAMMILGSVVVYWRIPRPASLSESSHRKTTATVRQVKVVDQIWTMASRYESGGQDIRKPFQMVDLEFTPPGASDSVHALDRLDVGSVPGLRVGSTVPILYDIANPRAAHIVGATSTYVQSTLVFLLGLAYGVAVVMGLVVFPAVGWAERFWRRVSTLAADSPVRLNEALSRLPANDPRRVQLEAFIRARKKAARADSDASAQK